MAAGMALLTMTDALSKWLTAGYPVGEILFFRALFMFPIIGLLAARAGGWAALRVHRYRDQVVRAVFVVMSTFLFLTGLTRLPLADTIAIVFAGPLMVTALAGPVVGEKVGWRRWLAVLVGFAGVMVMIRPGAGAFTWFALFPLTGALAGALRDLVTRRISASESSLAILWFSAVAITGAAALTMPFGWHLPTAHDLGLLALTGLLLGGANFLLIETFRLAEASLVIPFKYTTMVWAILYGYLFWGDLPDRWVVSGAVLVVVSGLYVMRRGTRM
jgi:drug/metabolite transporter (DMT)-like permease